MRGISPILVSVLLAAATISLGLFAYSFVFSTGSTLEAQANHFSPAAAAEIVGARSHEGTLCLHAYNPGGVPLSPAFILLRRAGRVVAHAEPLSDCNVQPGGTCWVCFPVHLRPGFYDAFLRWKGGTESAKLDVLVEGVPHDAANPWPTAWRLPDRRPLLPTDVRGGGPVLSYLSLDTERNSIIFADVDGDGSAEIVKGGSTGVVVSDGEALYNISFPANHLAFVADRLILGGEGVGVYTFNGDTFVEACSIPLSPGSLSYGDVDGDGTPEILFSADGNVHVYALDCSLRATFPGDAFLAYDFDGDGADEIFFLRASSVGLWDGNVVWERPATNPRAPTLGFLRGEPLGVYVEGNGVYGVDVQGSVRLSYTFPAPIAWAVAADMDGDSSTEIVALSDGNVYVRGSVNATRALPSSVTPAPPLLVSLSDPLDVVVAQENNVYVFSPNLALLGSFTLETSSGSTMPFPPAAADVDGDGNVEIAVSYTGGVLILDTGEAAGG